MAAAGTYALGPADGELTVATGKGGAAARAAHNLSILVQRWEATLVLAGDPAATTMSLTADAGSLRVLHGSGGMTALGDDDKAGITQTIDEEVLRGTAIAFRSTGVSVDGGPGRLRVRGELELAGASRPIEFALAVSDDGRVTATATITQSAHGIKPYSALFGTLKVSDDVEVSIDARIGAPS
jgi:polyisoprenoid-binding protein YceI